MENEENQNQVSLRFPPPLEIAPRFPQSHNPDDDSPLPKTQNQKARKEPQRLKKPQPPSSGSSFDEKMLDTPLAKAIAKVDERDAVIAELSTEIERVHAESAQKDAQIENLGRGLTDLERRHDEFTEKVPLERVAKIEADLQKVLRRRGGGG